jgi:hypothetical protein
MVRRHGRYFGIIQGKDLAVPIDAHTADAELTGIDKAPPLANMTPHPAARECLIEYRLPFHPSSLYHRGLPQYGSDTIHRGWGLSQTPTQSSEQSQILGPQGENSKQ